MAEINPDHGQNYSNKFLTWPISRPEWVGTAFSGGVGVKVYINNLYYTCWRRSSARTFSSPLCPVVSQVVFRWLGAFVTVDAPTYQFTSFTHVQTEKVAKGKLLYYRPKIVKKSQRTRDIWYLNGYLKFYLFSIEDSFKKNIICERIYGCMEVFKYHQNTLWHG